MNPINIDSDFHLKQDTLASIIDNSSIIIAQLNELLKHNSKELFQTETFTLDFNFVKQNFKILDLKKYSRVPQNYCLKTYKPEILSELFEETEEYLKKLKIRVKDNSSKVLVTGDLNAGKSTLINALLQVDLLPTDQQPCTQSFCEIINDQDTDSDCKVLAFKCTSPGVETESFPLEHSTMLEELQKEDSEYKWFKIFSSLPLSSISQNRRQYHVSTSFIDSPGLNTDLFKTMSVFDQQQDIDVIIFVINASFHLTLSGKEFLEQAAKEKEQIFFVVNKYDEIENVKKCKSLILKQIGDILPETVQKCQNLIHFVSAKKYLSEIEENDSIPSSEISMNFDEESQKLMPTSFKADFEKMKYSLMNFLYAKRSTSKLAPALNYSSRLLKEMFCLTEFYNVRMNSQAQEIEESLKNRSDFVENLEKEESNVRSKLNSIVMKNSEDCYHQSYNLATSFSNQISKLFAIPHRSGLWALRSNINDKYQLISKEYSETMNRIQDSVQVYKNSGLEEVGHLAISMGAKCEFSNQIVGDFRLYSSMPLPKPSILELIDARELLRNFGALNITSIVGAVVGFQPCLNIAWKIASNVGINPILMSFSVVGGLGAFIVYKTYSSIENAIFCRLESYFSSRFNKELWASDIADRCKQTVAVNLSNRSSQVFLAYQKMIEEGRQEAAEISAKSVQLKAVVEQMDTINRKIETLLKYCADIKL